MFSIFPYIARNMATCQGQANVSLFWTATNMGQALHMHTFRIQIEYTGISILVLLIGLPFVGAQFHILCI